MIETDKIFAFLHKCQAYAQSEEFQLYRSLRKYRLSLHTVRENYRSLFILIKLYHTRTEDKHFWNPENPYERWKLQIRLTTGVLNYLGSKETLVYLSRKFRDNHLMMLT